MPKKEKDAFARWMDGADDDLFFDAVDSPGATEILARAAWNAAVDEAAQVVTPGAFYHYQITKLKTRPR